VPIGSEDETVLVEKSFEQKHNQSFNMVSSRSHDIEIIGSTHFFKAKKKAGDRLEEVEGKQSPCR